MGTAEEHVSDTEEGGKLRMSVFLCAKVRVLSGHFTE